MSNLLFSLIPGPWSAWAMGRRVLKCQLSECCHGRWERWAPAEVRTEEFRRGPRPRRVGVLCCLIRFCVRKRFWVVGCWSSGHDSRRFAWFAAERAVFGDRCSVVGYGPKSFGVVRACAETTRTHTDKHGRVDSSATGVRPCLCVGKRFPVVIGREVGTRLRIWRWGTWPKNNTAMSIYRTFLGAKS